MNDMAGIQMRDAFIAGLLAHARAERDILFVSNEYGAPALDAFRKDLPEQFINAGISEQNLISVAAGLALAGRRVYVYSIASFITLRCFEQLKLDVCVHKVPVKILGVGCGFAYSEDGPTHHATEDISLMRSLAGMEIYSPSESQLAHDLVAGTLASTAPQYIRFDKGKYPALDGVMQDCASSFRWQGNGSGLLLISTGILVHRALEVADELRRHGIACDVIDLYRLKPLGAELQQRLSRATAVVTIEEHTLNGGLGSIIAEQLVDLGSVARFKRFGIPDAHLYSYGEREILHRMCGLDRAGISNELLRWLDVSNKEPK